VRLAALSASWSRDRQLGRRRLAWRWLLWGWWRFGLPLVLALALAAVLLLRLPPSSVPSWLTPVVSNLRLIAATSGAMPRAAIPQKTQKTTPAKEP
jgi:hypothetical protein